jgi:hypothetical protein
VSLIINNLILTMKKIILSILIITLFSIASLSFADINQVMEGEVTQDTDIKATDEVKEFNIDNPLVGTSDIYMLIDKIIDFLFGISILVTPIIVVYAGFMYVTSAGNEAKIKTAQKVIIWALVGFAIVLIAKSVPAIIQKVLYEEPATLPPEPFPDDQA